MEEGLEGRETETLGGVALLGEVLAVIGVESLMPLHRRSAVGDEVEAPGEGGTGTAIVTTTTGGYRHHEWIVIPRLPDVVDVEVAVETAGTV